MKKVQCKGCIPNFTMPYNKNKAKKKLLYSLSEAMWKLTVLTETCAGAISDRNSCAASNKLKIITRPSRE